MLRSLFVAKSLLLRGLTPSHGDFLLAPHKPGNAHENRAVRKLENTEIFLTFFLAELPQYFQNLLSRLSFLAEGHVQLLLLLLLPTPGGHFIHLLVQKRILLLHFGTAASQSGQIVLRE